MQLIKIDPHAQTVEVLECNGSLFALREEIGCRMIDVCARQDNGDSLTVDDESLFMEPQPPAFSYNRFGPIHGVGLLTGTDDEGACAQPLTTLETARSLVSWMGEIYTAPSLTVVPLYDLILSV